MLLLYDTQLFDENKNIITDVKNISLVANKERGIWEAKIQTNEFFRADVTEINIIMIDSNTALQIFLADKKKIIL
jgi:hypothetical protein